jgi:hypothetical protein
MDKKNEILLSFLSDIKQKIENEQMSEDEILQVYEFYYKFNFTKDGDHSEDDVIKYCALGYHIYSNLKKQDK